MAAIDKSERKTAQAKWQRKLLRHEIGRQLRAQYNAIVAEPPPPCLAALLNQLETAAPPAATREIEEARTDGGNCSRQEPNHDLRPEAGRDIRDRIPDRQGRDTGDLNPES
jgi:hypothetical protein